MSDEHLTDVLRQRDWKVTALVGRRGGTVEVMQVEPDLCYVRILNQKKTLHADDKVREKMVELAEGKK